LKNCRAVKSQPITVIMNSAPFPTPCVPYHFFLSLILIWLTLNNYSSNLSLKM
jgi:hypothetical protein